MAPSQTTLVGGEEGEYAAKAATWGFELFSSPLINARAETVGQKPTFARALREGRILVLISAWIDWDVKKQPYRIHRKDGRPVVTAGLLEGGRFVLLTSAPENPELRALRPRMPVVLPKAVWREWLEPGADPDDLQPLLRAFPGDVFALSPAPRAIGNVKNNYKELLEAV